MKSRITCLAALACLLTAAGCQHTGGASATRTEFGIPGFFKITNEEKDLKITEKKLVAGETATSVQILLFELKNSGKDVVIADAPEPKKLSPK